MAEDIKEDKPAEDVKTQGPKTDSERMPTRAPAAPAVPEAATKTNVLEPAPEARQWAPTNEHDQMTIVHAALLQGHVNSLAQSVASGSSAAVQKIHTDAIVSLAGKLADHVDGKVEKEDAIKVATDKAVNGAQAKRDWTPWIFAVFVAVIGAAYWASQHGFVHVG